MSKKPKKAGPSEEDDSLMDVYYREGKEEAEETNVLPKVRAMSRGGERLFQAREELGCPPPRPLLLHFL